MTKPSPLPRQPPNPSLYKVGRAVRPLSRGKPEWFSIAVLSVTGIYILVLHFAFPSNHTLPQPQQSQVSSTTPSVSVADNPQTSISMGQTVHVGYWSYAVWDIKWQHSIGSEYLHKTADSSFLVANVTVRNHDRTASTLPPFQLVDDKGREYDESADAAYLDGSFGLPKKVNPGVRADGYIVFDVPVGDYKLKVSGGLTSGQTALINLHY